jgi:hypothetical protein
MAWKNKLMALTLTSALLPMQAAIAADHRDGAAVLTDPSTDINDVYSWMSTDGTKVYLIMTVFPAADKNTSKFSTAAWYVFHTASRAGFTDTNATPVDIICGFDTTQKISCWVGSSANFVSGDASATAGISSADGKVKVFAGPRKDHFFFNLDGFKAASTCVKGVLTAGTPPTPDAAGCFYKGNTGGGLTDAQTAAVAGQLSKAPPATAGQCPGTGAAVDFFAQLNTLSIVLAVDKSLLTAGGKYFSVWGATHTKQ